MFRRSGPRKASRNVINGTKESTRTRSSLRRYAVMGGIALGLPAVFLLSNHGLFGDAITAGLVVFEIPSDFAAKSPVETVQESDVDRKALRIEATQTDVEPVSDTVNDNSTATSEPLASQLDNPDVDIIDKKSGLVDDNDKDCPWRESPIYRKVFVYPNYGEVENGWSGSILSEAGRNLTSLPRWPWLDLDKHARHNQTGHYNIKSSNVQYTTELLVREIMINPKSCLRTYDPEQATLFYVPYLPSIEHHVGHDHKTDYSTSPWGSAILDILDRNNYTAWENQYGLTSKYWKRRAGADHILVFSEPMHGLWHPRSRRGNYHFIHSQKQLTPPIVISVELSTTFVQMFPLCAAKNILMPYPNTDGNWFNGNYQQSAQQLGQKSSLTAADSPVALPADAARPVAQFYSAGNHGTCRQLRRSMQQDYQKCAPSYKVIRNQLQAHYFGLGMHLSTFCPCPGGDSPSAKRHFDALLAGCIPIILSQDFVWPFTNEFDPEIDWDPHDFALRLNASDYAEALLDPETCQPVNATRGKGLQAYLESIPASEIERLREGMQKAKHLYSWYAPNETLTENPLREGVLPQGGTAHQLVRMLAERAAGAMWPACQEELKRPRRPDPHRFKC